MSNLILKMPLKYCCLTAILVVGFTVATGQNTKIDTDRPDQTESSYTVPKKWFQFEMGFNRQQNNPSDIEFLLPTLLSKYGITKKIELRLITTLVRYPSQKIIPFGTQYKTGLAPVELGTKIALFEEKKWIPKTSLLLHVAIPGIASKDLQTKYLAPRFRFSLQNTLSKLVALGYNLGVEWDGVNNDPSWIYTLSPGFDISEKWYAYVELFGSFSKLETPQHNIAGGFAYYPTRNFKLDLSGGVGISPAAPSWYISLGGSIRFKTGK